MACPRPRMTRKGHVYHTAKYMAWKAEAARLLMGALWDHKPIMGPVVLALTFVVTRPKNTKLTHPSPDIDNYCKSIMDAMNGLAWVDDEQVIALSATKAWAPQGSLGHIEVALTQI